MSNIKVCDRNGVLVVDSRLIALELGIKHESFCRTIRKYRIELEEEFGAIEAQKSMVNTSDFKSALSNVQEIVCYWLTEDWAKVLMTYSKNTEQVRQCKRELVKAFSAAKQTVYKIIPELVNAVEQLRQENQQLRILVAENQSSIATLQSQIQLLLPPDPNTPVPGWTQENWSQLPHQDKRHFRYLGRARKFRPSDQGKELRVLPLVEIQEYKHKQRSEVEAIVGEVSAEEKQRIEIAKQEMLARFWAEGGAQS